MPRGRSYPNRKFFPAIVTTFVVFTCFFWSQLPDEVQEQITRLHGGKPPTEALITHFRRELMHAVWCALLDDEFVDAWKHGVVIVCADGVKRRVFPRILTYSADYPEK